MITLESPRVAFAFMQRDACMSIAREAHMAEQPIYVRLARLWHRKAMRARRLEQFHRDDAFRAFLDARVRALARRQAA